MQGRGRGYAYGMPRPLLTVCTAATLALGSAAHAQSMGDMPGPEHHQHMDMPEHGEKLGHVVFPTSCAAGSQAQMERGVALLHSFAYATAQLQFEAIAKADPTCAMAHWGIAMTQFQELWGRPDAAELQHGTEEMARARALAAPPASITARERGYIDALSAFFAPGNMPFEQRANAYTEKMNALRVAYTSDVEAAAFDALSLLASSPPNDTSLTHERQALAILVPLFAAHPDHPGLAHYIIHTCDTPSLAPEGLSAAREYAAIAPSSPHALHMPGHIFARLGMWQEDIQSNLASVRASEQAMAAHEPGAAHQMHADEFLIYAWLQTGQDAKARALTEEMPSVSQHMAAMPGMDDMKEQGPFFANELRAIYALEMHDWKAASVLQPIADSNAASSYAIYWARGIAAGHLHDPAVASAALTGMDQAFATLQTMGAPPYILNSVKIKRDEMRGWQAFAQDQPELAISLLRQAADQQDKLGQDEVDIPAREMLGDVLLLEHKSADALAAYKIALKLSPNRLNGLLSAATAAEQAGIPGEALAYDRKAAAQTGGGKTSQRPELVHAVQVASQRLSASSRR